MFVSPKMLLCKSLAIYVATWERERKVGALRSSNFALFFSSREALLSMVSLKLFDKKPSGAKVPYLLLLLLLAVASIFGKRDRRHSISARPNPRSTVSLSLSFSVPQHQKISSHFFSPHFRLSIPKRVWLVGTLLENIYPFRSLDRPNGAHPARYQFDCFEKV